MKKTNLIKRTMSITLCIIMVLGMTPLAVITAFAAGSVSYVQRSWDGSKVVSATKAVDERSLQRMSPSRR